jgi:Flp pilus assembly protein TadD
VPNPERSSNAAIWNELGCAQVLTGQIEVAESSFKRAIALGLTNGSPEVNLASLYTSRGRYLEAISLLEQALTAHPDLETLLELADCYRQMGAQDSARLGYERVLQVFPGHPRAVAGLAIMTS